MRVVVSIAIVGSLCAACAGRRELVPVVQAQDRYMDCAEIADEVEANDQKVAGLVSEKGPKTTFSAMAFGMDWGTQDNEITALQSRQQYLVTLAEQRRCGVAALRMTLPADESSNDITPPASASALFPHSPR
jgi:hypothetical protein